MFSKDKNIKNHFLNFLLKINFFKVWTIFQQVSPSGEVAEEIEDRPLSASRSIQSRPLPAPPAPTRTLKKGHRRTPSPHAAGLLARSSFHSVASTLDRWMKLWQGCIEKNRVTFKQGNQVCSVDEFRSQREVHNIRYCVPGSWYTE